VDSGVRKYSNKLSLNKKLKKKKSRANWKDTF
jgi:hypothetical protein